MVFWEVFVYRLQEFSSDVGLHIFAKWRVELNYFSIPGFCLTFVARIRYFAYNIFCITAALQVLIVERCSFIEGLLIARYLR